MTNPIVTTPPRKPMPALKREALLCLYCKRPYIFLYMNHIAESRKSLRYAAAIKSLVWARGGK